MISRAALVAVCSLALTACVEDEGTGSLQVEGRGLVAIPWWVFGLAATVWVVVLVIRSRRGPH